MAKKFRAKLIKDGDGMLVHLPESMMEMSGLRDEVVLEYTLGKVIIRPATPTISE